MQFLNRLTACLAALAAAWLLSASAVHAHPGTGIVMDAKGNVYYTDLSQVWRIAPDGKKNVVVPNVHTHELYLDDKGDLFGEHLWYSGEATDIWRHRVWVRRANGRIEDVIAAREGFLAYHRDFSYVRDGAGTSYWADGTRPPMRIVRKRKGSAVEVHARGPFGSIRSMVASPDGTLHLIDFGRTSDLKRVAPDGTVTTLAANLAERAFLWFADHHDLMGLWLDAAGNVYTAVAIRRQVKRITPDGTVSVVASAEAPWRVSGGLVAPDGALWLLEYSVVNAVRVRRIAPDGRIRVY